jgi:hypothetical protein
MRINKDRKFKKGDLVKFIDIETSVDTLPPIGYLKIDSWSRFLTEENYSAKKDDAGVIVIPQKKNLNITYAQVMVNNKLYWFDVDNLEKLEVYST